MPTLMVIGGIKITVYADDHNPPHFHILTAEGDVLVRISTMQVMAGTIRAKDLRIAMDWVLAHRREIENEWDRLNS
ncbi:hypothetical protein NS226_21990 [Aureimonas ureilytica]|uniref:DUF4160 domain-containing protein n=1 Tax=Aureimonas ureilytica TaxID=401562 RepID=A0A175R4T0_9HYPH|nr:DUF4160 domain-containing protein [Aureimonas ureilytica]KTQ83943.1 hypothetical protein NS226_21990 [Aureimonas ureilytica]